MIGSFQVRTWKCDVCHASFESRDGADPRPKGWARLTLKRDAYDYLGQAAADGTFECDLCAPCHKATQDAINATAAELRAAHLARKPEGT